MDVINEACGYARFRMRVFPVRWNPGAADHKAPMPNYAWRLMATTDVYGVVRDFELAISLWGEDNVMIAWALGEDGFMAVDLDIGDEPEWIQAVDWAAAVNPTAKGRHLVFEFPEGFEPSNSASGFPTSGWGEVRGKGGYIIIAGPDRPGFDKAQLERCQPFPRPEWLSPYGGGAQAVGVKEVQDFAVTYSQANRPAAIHGLETAIENFVAAREAGSTASRHDFAIWAVTCAAEDAIKGYYGFAEGLMVVRQWWLSAVPQERHGREWNGIVAWSVGRALQENPPTVAEDGDVAPVLAVIDGITPSVEPLDLVGRWRADRAQKEWLIEPLLPEGRSASLTADAKAGKSELTLYIVACLAQGIDPWTGHERDPVATAYFDFEMTEDDVFERLESFGFTGDEDWSNLSYFLLPPLAPLDTTGGSSMFLEAVDSVDPDLVVIDTLMRTLAGDENDAFTFQAFYRLVGMTLKQRRKTSVRLDHFGKDKTKGSRGSSAKDADVDVIWSMTRTGRYSAKLTSRSRVSWVPDTFFIERYQNPHVNFAPRDQAIANLPSQAVHEAMVMLDLLDVPLDWGRQRVSTWLVDNSHPGINNNVLADAIRLRKDRKPSGTGLTLIEGGADDE
jgi:hypothetical protein